METAKNPPMEKPKDGNDLLVESFVNQCAESPTFFIRYFLGINLTPAQQKLCESIAKNDVTVAVFGRQCLTAGTLITMGDGTLKPIEKIIVGDEVISLNTATFKYEKNVVKNTWVTEPKPVYNIVAGGVRKIRCSSKHQFLSMYGTWESIESGLHRPKYNFTPGPEFWKAHDQGTPWQTAKECLATIRLSNVCQTDDMNEDEARFLGYFMADGSYTKGQAMKFTNITPSYLQEVQSLVSKLFPDTVIKSYKKGNGEDLIFLGKNSYKDRWHPHGATAFVRKHGLYHIDGPHKTIPRDIFNSSDKIKGAFLNRYWAADGCVYISRLRPGRKIPSVEMFIVVETVEQGIDFSALLASMGISSHLKNPEWGKKATRPIWRLVISQSDSILRFFEKVGPIYGKEKKSNEAIVISQKKRDVWMHKRYRENVYFESINKVEAENVSEVMYDIEVEKNHNFVANGFVVHNSGKSTAVAAFLVWRLVFGKGVEINGTQIPDDILVAAPSLPQAKIIYDKVRTHIVRNELLQSYVAGDMTLEKITMHNGNVCRVVSASVTAQIRGLSPTLLVTDESGDIQDNVINAVLIPMTVATRAHRVFVGTPKGRNWFYRVITEDKNANVIKQTYLDCPFLDHKAIERKRTDRGGTTPIQLWQQEYEVKFLEEASAPLPTDLVKPCLADYDCVLDSLEPEELPPVESKSTHVMGVDLGRERDSTVITIIRCDRVPYHVVHIESHLGKPYTHIMGRVKLLSEYYHTRENNVDQTSEKGWGDLATEVGVPINPINFNLVEKENMIKNLQVLFEKKLLILPIQHEVLFSQIVNQQYKTTSFGRRQYFHPEDEHDDHLWSLALAAMAVQIDVGGYDEKLGFIEPTDGIGARVAIGTPPIPLGSSLKQRDAIILKAFRNEQKQPAADKDSADSMVVNHSKWATGKGNG